MILSLTVLCSEWMFDEFVPVTLTLSHFCSFSRAHRRHRRLHREQLPTSPTPPPPPPHLLQFLRNLLNTMMLETTGAKTVTSPLVPCLIFSCTCTAKCTKRFVCVCVSVFEAQFLHWYLIWQQSAQSSRISLFLVFLRLWIRTTDPGLLLRPKRSRICLQKRSWQNPPKVTGLSAPCHDLLISPWGRFLSDRPVTEPLNFVSHLLLPGHLLNLDFCSSLSVS